MSFPGPSYRIQIYAFLAGGTYGIGALLAELHLSKNLGFGDTLNQVPEAFFTISQDDPKLPLIRGYQGKAHVRILRDDVIVWAGWFGLEQDANERDVIFTCYGYLAGLYWAATDWNVQYTNAQIDTIVSAAWTRAKTGITSSPLNFVATGTIEAPVTTSGGATAIVLPKYSEFYKRILFVMQEMSALAISDTTNTVVFEITHAAAPTFNYWKNRGAVKADVVWRYGDGFVSGFHESSLPVYKRNDILAVGSAPNNTLLRYEWTSSGDITTYGTRQEPIYLQWVRDQLELQRSTGNRGALAQRVTTDLTLSFAPNSVVPPLGTGAGFRMSDQAKVIVDRGATNINANYLIAGYRVLYLRGNEHTRVLLQSAP
jgi:hypothetical protein